MDAIARPKDLRDKRYIAYARCASKQGSTQSLRRQIRLIRQFGARLGMRCVGEVRVPGVSGFTPALRPDLRRILTRKHEKDDFDVLIAEDYARVTRVAIARIATVFAISGVRIVYLMDWHGDDTAMLRRMAQEQRIPLRDDADSLRRRPAVGGGRPRRRGQRGRQ